ncbi:Fanconi anemia group D2 protein-like [Daphnia carinata]|uniref:Fanconi anemia group D2 protein-like n=1 Tax=Daphnia carinata TaxID=120202 RepID=UPI0025802B67|nr:Fanconi anemia group D2 protein-like [Daphnia carinata]
MNRNNVSRKRATMMLDSDDEDDDVLGALPPPKTKKRKAEDIDNLANGPADFIKTLTEAGFYPRTGNLPNLLSVQPFEFQQSLREHLTTSVHYPRSIEFFVSECDTFFNNRDNFIKALHLTENSGGEETSNAITLPQDSLVRLLLQIDEIQPKLMATILKRFTKAANEERPLATGVNLPSLILSQIAWLNRIVDPVHVVDTLLDLLNSSSSTIRKEIISCLPSVVGDKENIRVAFVLCGMLEETNNSLTAAILDVLGDLSLPVDEAAEIRRKVVKRLPTVPLETVPVLLTFVFKRIKPDETTCIIKEVGLHFDKIFKKRHERVSKETINDCISLSTESIQNSMIGSKSLADTWLKEIQSKTELTCIDLLVLVIQHKLSGRRLEVELTIRKKIRSETLTTELVKETFKLYDCVLKNHFEQLCAIADSLILTSDPLLALHGSVCFQEMFVHFDEFYQQEVVQALIQYVSCAGHKSSSDNSPATAALIVLQELADANWNHLVRFSAFIVSLLEYIEYMALPQVKRVMELLAKMAYGFSMTDETKVRLASFSASIQSELLMIIKKQLAGKQVEYQRMGILGSVALIHVLANPELVGELSGDGQFSQSSSSLTITDSSRSGILQSDQRLIQAKAIIDLVNASTKHVPEVTALFMDEMASTSLVHDIHPSLHSYLYDGVSEKFQEHFVVDETEQQIDNFQIPLSLQYGLDTVEEDTPSVSMVFLNIAPMVIKEQNRKDKRDRENANQPSLTTLMSHFRLLRNTIDSFEEANLEDIDALLGCALCLPTDEGMDDFERMPQTDKDIVCRCYFYGTNWCIEVINTFARSKPMRAKVIQRLRDVVELKKKFYRALAKNSSFMPPPSVFLGEPPRAFKEKGKSGAKKKAAAPKKDGTKGKGANKVNNQNDTTLATPNKSILHSTPRESVSEVSKFDFVASQPGKVGEPDMVVSTYPIHFRELDLSAFVLLSSTLDLTENDATTSLKPTDLELLLGDLAAKLEHKLLTAAPKRRFPLKQESDYDSFLMLDLYIPLEVAKRSVSLIRRLTTHLEAISGYFQQLIEMSDGMLDGPEMFTELAQRLGNSYTLIFRILNRIFSWHEFQKSTGAPLLEDALRFIAGRVREDAKTANLEELQASSFDYIEKFSSSITSFSCAVEHVQLLVSLYNHRPDPELSERLAMVAEGYLKRSWNTADGESNKGSKFNRDIENMIQVYLLHGSNVFGKLEDIITNAMAEVIQSDGSESESFRTCNNATFTFYFRAAFVALVENVKKIPGPGASPTSLRETFKTWEKVVFLLNQLVETVKTNDKRSILISCLKHGRLVIEFFYKLAMPLLDKQFKNIKEESQELLKNLQKSTRMLQNVCNHAKISSDQTLAANIPAMTRIREAIFYRVKHMLAAHGCAGAFWIGNLKNKNLKGQEILSQTSIAESDDGGQSRNASSEEDDTEEEDDDVTVLRENIAEPSDSDSRSREY